ncbi:unnamed protein product [Cuscuta epithymum]|uniref:Uncharacterized protein n=1 Tax=Cuscuta epithymum TaxID=186058 RepID=A0AAV0GF50_9ASTE|nr:unnamed protein product [Cuscuta epithymum]CAH9146266.1 unnamed protein product [Cuscuta epithymum]
MPYLSYVDYTTLCIYGSSNPSFKCTNRPITEQQTRPKGEGGEEGPAMKGTAKMNAMRSGLVVIGALAFGYLTLHLGLKPFLQRAEAQQHHLLPDPSNSDQSNL